MSLVVGQIVYSSFPQIGYQVFANSEIPERVQSAFVEEIVHKHWDVYEPPPPGYKAGFIYQIQADHTLFGWLFDDGDDDHGRPHTPYCLGYYLNQPLDSGVVDFMTQCLQKGPMALISRQRVPEQPEQIELVSDYESAAPGITFTDVQQQQIHRWVQQQLLLRCLFTDIDVPVSIADFAAETLLPQAWEQKSLDIHPELEKSALAPLLVAVSSNQQLINAAHLSHNGLTAPQRQERQRAPATMLAGSPAGSPGQRVAKRKVQSEDLARQIISILDETL